MSVLAPGIRRVAAPSMVKSSRSRARSRPPVQEYIVAGSVPAAFRDVYSNRRTGVLRFGRGEDNCNLRFVKGSVVYAASSAPDLHLGRILLQAQMATAEQLEKASLLVVQQRKRLGEALMQIGALDAEQLEPGLALHVQTVVARLLTWNQGLYYFEEADPELSGSYDQPLEASTGQLLLEAARMVRVQSAVRFGLGDADRVLLPASDPLLRFQHVDLTPIEGFVLSRIDGTLTAAEVSGVIPLPEAEVERSLLALLCSAMIEYADKKARQEQPGTAQFLRQEIIDLYASLNDRSYFELLGIPEDASDAQVQSAYMRLAKRYHPDAHHEQGLKDLADKLEAIFFKLTDAFETLEDAPGRLAYLTRLRPAPDPAPAPAGAVPSPSGKGPSQVTVTMAPPSEPLVDPGRAEEVYQQAAERFGDGKFWEAVGLLSVAISLTEGRLQRRARVLLARCYLKYPEKAKDAETQLRLVVGQDPGHADAHYFLGTLYRRSGLAARARAMFRKTLELKPRHREAAAELETLGREPGAGDGVLKKLFGRE